MRALVTRPDQISLVERLDPDIVVAVGYAHIVPEEILAVPSEGCVNVHPGYLPHLGDIIRTFGASLRTCLPERRFITWIQESTPVILSHV